MILGEYFPLRLQSLKILFLFLPPHLVNLLRLVTTKFGGLRERGVGVGSTIQLKNLQPLCIMLVIIHPQPLLIMLGAKHPPLDIMMGRN
jgi:hypothetical protein